jgi:large subunit ribosomal protein L6
MLQIVAKRVEIPDGVTVIVDGKRVKVTGEKGRLVRDFSGSPTNIEIEVNQVVVSTDQTHRKAIAMVGTVSSHINNMIKGVTQGFTYKLKIVYAHFPISVKIEGDKILIENFLGERSPRVAKIVGDVNVTVKGDDVIVQGINIEEVGQTAANIEQATKIKKKDPRKFLDGIYVYEKHEGFEE